MKEGDIIHAPVMETIPQGVVVKRPDGEAAPPVVGPNGGVSVGPAYLSGVGAVIHVAVHHPDGSTLVATMGREGFTKFALAMNAAAARIQNGLYQQPETRQ